MAEYLAVMKQARRMCHSYLDCTECAFGKSPQCPLKLCSDHKDDAVMEEAERIVMDWAEEHPEPRYPSWHEAWKQLFPESKYIPCPVDHFGLNLQCNCNCEKCKGSQMTSGIAEKLGIKPIGGNADA